MIVVVHVRVGGPDRPPLDSPVVVQVQETLLADAPATVLAQVTGRVRGEMGGWLETVELRLERAPESSTVRAHVDVDSDGRVSKGDFVTTAAYPVPDAEEATLDVTVKPV